MDNAAMHMIPTLLSVISGIYICAALYHLCFAARKIQTGLHLTFGMMCIMAAGYCLSEQAIYSSSSIPSFVYALKWQLCFGIVFMTGAIWFTVFFADYPSPRPACLLSIAAIVLLTLNLFLPRGILIEKIHRFEHLSLPWNEQIAFPSTDLAWWTIILWLFSLTVYLFVLHGCRRLWSAGRRRAALVLGANVLFFLIAGMVDLAIDLRQLRWVYVAEFRFLLCVVSMAAYSSRHFSRKA